MRRRDLLLSPVLFAPLLLAPAARSEPAFGLVVAAAAEARTLRPELYDPAYRVIGYPMGDVPDDRGVCTDVVIRAFRNAGIDLQVLVHQDMRRAFAAYPSLWGLKRPDRNIDHRRVPNLETFFKRRGLALPLSRNAADYQTGDVVSWRLTGTNLPHIGIVSSRRSANWTPLIVHNIGAGSQLEDVLFAWPMTGWFRWSA